MRKEIFKNPVPDPNGITHKRQKASIKILKRFGFFFNFFWLSEIQTRIKENPNRK
ncbi:hypothetical protein ML462_11420 [Gramella lutea]|uniref:Uncharacterized protein n=1 Tax=Christiangramia lutea TaxID=1607951 RepID=A0A9X2A9X4_9FLAO|nr:hypothetical protein [Christiangramia lutea]MCH4823780.1 hypothetical protein [Christiangramia lutea]